MLSCLQEAMAPPQQHISHQGGAYLQSRPGELEAEDQKFRVTSVIQGG